VQSGSKSVTMSGRSIGSSVECRKMRNVFSAGRKNMEKDSIRDVIIAVQRSSNVNSLYSAPQLYRESVNG
jgi:hypothetical protein